MGIPYETSPEPPVTQSGRAEDRGPDAFGATGSATTLALLGDSHASHWLGGLERAGQTHGWRIEPFVAGACPVADLRGLVGGAAARLYRPCARFQEATMRRLAELRPRAVILSNSDYYMKGGPGRTSDMGVPESVWTEDCGGPMRASTACASK